MPRRLFSPLDALRKFIPAETFKILDAPTKASMEMMGQEQLPLGEDFTDPTDRVSQYREHMAQMEGRQNDVLSQFQEVQPGEIDQPQADPFLFPDIKYPVRQDTPVGLREEDLKWQLDKAKNSVRRSQVIPAHLVDQYGPAESEILHGMGDIPASSLASIGEGETEVIPGFTPPGPTSWLNRFPTEESRPDLEAAWRRGEIDPETAKTIVASWKSKTDQTPPMPVRSFPERVVEVPPKESRWVAKEKVRSAAEEKHYDGQTLTDEDYEAKYGHRKPVYQVDPSTLPTRQVARETWPEDSPFPVMEQVTVPGQPWWDPITLAEQRRDAQAAVDKVKYPVKPKGLWKKGQAQPDIALVPSQGQAADAVYPPGKWQQYDVPAAPQIPGDEVEGLHTRRASLRQPQIGKGLRFNTGLEGLANLALNFNTTPGKEPKSLFDLKRGLENVTSEGIVQRMAPSRVPMTPSAQVAANELVELGIIKPPEIQVLWDRVMGERGPFNAGTVKDAEEEFDRIVMGMVDAYNGLRATGERDADGGYITERLPLLTMITPEAKARFAAEVGPFRPDKETPEQYRQVVQDYLARFEPELSHEQRVRLAQSYLSEANSIFTGKHGEGIAEKTFDEDESHNAAQITEKGIKGLGSAFQGNPNKSDEREGTGKFDQTIDVKKKELIGQKALDAINYVRAGMKSDQTANIRSGRTDFMVVDRGQFAVGPDRLGTEDPFDIEVMEVIPFSEAMKAGYLAEVSKRTGVPLRNLKIMAQLQEGNRLGIHMPLDLVRVKPVSGPAQPDLPSMARRRTPEQLKFWGTDAGNAQRDRIMANPKVLERILASPNARIIAHKAGAGHDFVAVVVGKGSKDTPVNIWGIRINPQNPQGFDAVPLSRHEGKVLWKMGRKKSGELDPHYLDRRAVEKDPASKMWPEGTVPKGFGAVTGVEVPPLATPRPDQPARPIGEGTDPAIYADELPGASHPAPGMGHPYMPGLASESSGGFSTKSFADDATESRVLKHPAQIAPYYANPDALPKIPGITLSETPLRTQEDLVKFPFYLENEPLLPGIGGSTPDMTTLPSGKQPELTVVITQRRPSNRNPEGFAKYSGKEPRTLINPTADQLRTVLLHSKIQNVVFKVFEGEKKGTVGTQSRALNTWQRAKALMGEVRRPRAGTEYTPAETVQRNLGPKAEPHLPPGVVTPSKKFETGEVDEEGNPILQPVQERMFEEGLYGLPRSVNIDPKVLDTLRLYEKGGVPSPLAIEKKVKRADEARQEKAELRQVNVPYEAIEKRGLPKTGPQPVGPGGPGPEGFGSTTDLIKAHRERRALRALLKGGKLGAGALAILFGKNFLSDDDQAEAATRGNWKAAAADATAARSAQPVTYDRSMTDSFRRKFLDMFTDVYSGVRKAGGTKEDELELRERISTAAGGGGAEAVIDFEPIKQVVDAFEYKGLGSAFNTFVTAKQGLRQWDIVAAKRDMLYAEATTARGRGQAGLAAQKKQLADAINLRMANNEVWQGNKTKEDLVADLKDLRNEVGVEAFAEMQAGSKDIYAQVQSKLDEMYQAGLIPEDSYRLYKERGGDHIPAFKTAWKVDKDTGELVYAGGEKFEAHSTSIKGTTEQLLQEVMGDTREVKSPFENAAQFISEGTAEIKRSQIAQAVIDKFMPLGVVKRLPHKPKPDQRAAEGNSFYTILEKGEPVTYEMPAYLIDSLLMVDKEVSKKLLNALPDLKAISVMRALPEAGMTTLNVGFGLAQATAIDPISSMIQMEWANNKILRNIAPFALRWFKHLYQGLTRGGGESSAMRKRAAKAGALYAGASSHQLDPRDLLGNQSWKRAGEAYDKGHYGQMVNDWIQGALHTPTKRIMQPLEEATKLATFDLQTKLMADKGEVNDRKAAYQTRKYGGSPDWGQGGAGDAMLKSFVTFGKPTFLGIEAALMSAKRDPVKLGKVMMGTAAIELAREGFNQMTASELGVSQEELENRFSEYDKDNTFLVMVPPTLAKKMFGQEQEILSNGIERPYALKHTIPPVLRLWMSPFKGLAKALHSGNPLDVPVGIGDEMLPGSVPLRADNLLGSAGRRLASSVPAPIRVPIEIGVDKQAFTGAPIVGSRLEGLAPGDQYSESTAPTYRWLGQKLSQAPLPNALKSPKVMEYLGDAFLPGPLQTPIQMADQALADKSVPRVEKGQLEALGDIPFLGPSLFKRYTPQRYEQELGDMQDKFYGLNARTRASAMAMNKFNQGVRMEPNELTQVLASANPEVNAIVRQLSELSLYQQQVIAHPTLSPREKRDYIKQIIDAKRDTLRSFLAHPAAEALTQDLMPPGVGVAP